MDKQIQNVWQNSPESARRALWPILGGLLLLLLAWNSFYTVSPTEMANTRLLGMVQNDQPLGPGLHFKVPLLTQVDTIQVSLRTLHIPEFDVNTVDNQKISLTLNFNYTVPRAKVNHLLYEIGSAGNKDLDDSIIPIVQDRAARVFSAQNTTTISLNRETIQALVQQKVFDAVREAFGIQPHSLQIARIGYSEGFIASNETAVEAKNETIGEQNKVNLQTAIAEQKVAEAKGGADSAIEQARGESQAAVLRAQADKTRQELEGLGQSSRLKAEIGAFGGNAQLYVEYQKALALQRWNGALPSVQGGAAGGPNIVIPWATPATK